MINLEEMLNAQIRDAKRHNKDVLLNYEEIKNEFLSKYNEDTILESTEFHNFSLENWYS